MKPHVFSDSARAGIYRLSRERVDLAVAAAGKAGLKVLEADVGDCSNRDAVLKELAPAWNLPNWYGANLDALHDCLTDPDWQPASGHFLVLLGLDRLRAVHPDDFDALIEVFDSVAEVRREDATPFWILLDTAAPGIALLPEA